MKRFLIFLLALTLPIGLLSGTHKAIGAMGDDLVMHAVTEFGDPACIEGLQLQLVTECGQNMRWTTDYTAGDPEGIRTEFAFSQTGWDTPYQASRGYFSLFSQVGVGASTSGGDGFEFGDQGMDKVLSAVAAQAPANGQEYRVQVDLKDYLQEYPLHYEARIFRGDKGIDEFYDGMGDRDEPGTAGAYRSWVSHFRFPVEEGSMVEVAVTKYPDGSIRDYNFNTLSGTQVSFVAEPAREGLYFAPVFTDGDGKVLTTGRYPEGNGVYYLPYIYSDESQLIRGADTYYHSTFDFSSLKRIYPMSDNSCALGFCAQEERDLLHLLTWEEGTFYYASVRLSDGAQLHRIPVMPCDSAALSFQYYPQQQLLIVKTQEQLALVSIGEAPAVELVARLPKELYMRLPETVLYQDGALYMAVMEWLDEGRGFRVTQCSADGLGFSGWFCTNLNDAYTSSNSKGYIQPRSVTILGK